MSFLQVLEPLAELLEPRIVQALAEPPRDLDLDLLRLLVGIRGAQHGFEQVGVEHERLEVVADGIDVDVLVDQLDRLRPERVPQKLARAGRRLARTRRPA